MVPLTATDLIIALKQAAKQTENQTTLSEHVSTCRGSTHVHPLGGVDEDRHPLADVQLHADHWDQRGEPDTLDHLRPPSQLYSLNS